MPLKGKGFYLGNICIRGHITCQINNDNKSLRYISNGGCLACHKVNPKIKAKKNRDYYLKNKEKCKAASKKYRDETGYERIRYNRNKQYFAAKYKKWAQENPEKNKARCTAYDSRLRVAKPKWANYFAIRAFYSKARQLSKETGIPHRVDHIIPIKHPNICGLHVETNLQVLTARENLKKRNKLEIKNGYR